MGNQDNWTTPKQIKIEREGEPRGVRRGPLKKGERRKGIKARLDLLKSSKRTLQYYADWMLRERQRKQEHPEWYRPTPGYIRYEPHHERYFDLHQKKHFDLLRQALKDGIIESAAEWFVEKP